ncbi:hypothetical protein [Thermoplasma acidophilum]|uniref:Uncharacterized protein n=1 Tax=Thermoplasma acidophilum (strain ATCC 25905 / DSM 1728 / JCM 9062 / NBRC 15155 / AMRC-C165) TaxID=273075 RepID=Q9HJV8_THEAC|nr:hypothetical protein [Thermoplasma acidophilum]MCY0851151.1 hypothetical protein [Thermoplasma acidophilum]CAC11984.1 hypothetical protein [Thermoplasma acidophilum]
MNVLFKRLIIVAVAVAIVVPTVYYAVSLNNSTQKQSDPLYYAPSDSSMIGYVNYNGTHLYIFANNRSYGIIVDSSSLSSLNFSRISSLTGKTNVSQSGNGSGLNLTSKVNIVMYANYKNYQIYMIKNISFSFAGVSFGNQSIYLYTDNGFVVIGNINGIFDSINATLNGRNAVGYSGYINTGANVSLAIFNLTDKFVKSVYLNMTGYNVTGKIVFTNYTYESYFISMASNIRGFNVTGVNDLSLLFTMNARSFDSVYEFIGVLNGQ